MHPRQEGELDVTWSIQVKTIYDNHDINSFEIISTILSSLPPFLSSCVCLTLLSVRQ